ncbi:MATE family efflux transporter [Caulobacter sp. KR2-114]|uniref:MATE family efflux transporter n=1 Tax=Caulobacter sp. KR2-114 TaxID=3400912 RepID=UPI003BFC9F3E
MAQAAVGSDGGGLSRAILAIALPAMLTNVATALFGLADMWVIGRLGDAPAQGGVEVGAKLLTTVLVVFNFLRSSTVALTAQAAGRGEEDTQAEVLVRALFLALVIAALLLAAMPWVSAAGLAVLGAQGAIRAQAGAYVAIRYWSAAPFLFGSVLTGWLVGRRQVRAVLAVEVGSNIVHVALDLTLVLGLGLGVAGVASATLVSETLKFTALALMAAREPPARRALAALRHRATWAAGEIGALLRLNRDLFARTVLLMAVVTLLTRAGARQGAVVLAANAILYQLFMLSALMLDGFESAAQVLCGEALGAGDRPRFERLVRAIMVWGMGFALAISAVYALAGGPLAASFSTAPAVIGTVLRYRWWAAALPVAGLASFVLDGVFIGASWTRAMMLTMAAALAGYVLVLWLGRALGNDSLWLAYLTFFLFRAAGQSIALPGLTRRSFQT